MKSAPLWPLAMVTLGAEFGVSVVGRAVLDGDIHGHVFFRHFGQRQAVQEFFEVAFHFVPRPRGVALEFAVFVHAPIRPGHHVGEL